MNGEIRWITFEETLHCNCKLCVQKEYVQSFADLLNVPDTLKWAIDAVDPIIEKYFISVNILIILYLDSFLISFDFWTGLQDSLQNGDGELQKSLHLQYATFD